MAPTFLGGKLKLKGKKKKKKSKHGLSKNSTSTRAEDTPLQSQDDAPIENDSDEDDNLTETERKSLERKKERERIEIEETARKSHRERVEEFNEKIGNLTELNDIPRVSNLSVVIYFFVGIDPIRSFLLIFMKCLLFTFAFSNRYLLRVMDERIRMLVYMMTMIQISTSA